MYIPLFSLFLMAVFIWLNENPEVLEKDDWDPSAEYHFLDGDDD